MTVKNVSHPYLPKDLHLPHYVPNDKSVLELLVVFFSLVGVFTVGIFVYAGRVPHTSRLSTRLKVCWFLVCGLIHCILEGYFSVFHKTLVSEQTFLAQLWKEYGLGDSRYVSGDTFTVCMESITAFIDGPLAFLAVYAFLENKPYRHVVQILLSLCQLYGDTLYFSTEVMDGFIHGHMYHPLYFWFYFVFLNSLWIIIPAICIYESYRELSKAQSVRDNNQVRSKKKK